MRLMSIEALDTKIAKALLKILLWVFGNECNSKKSDVLPLYKISDAQGKVTGWND